MIKFKDLRSILLTTGITLGLSLSVASSAFASTYTAVSGDSLYKISQAFDTTVSNLMSENNLTSTALDIGQVLIIPSAKYTVEAGESLYLIAQKYEITLDSLRQANNIYTDLLDIGQTLIIPVAPVISAVPATVVSSIQSTLSSIQTTVATSDDTDYSSSDLDLLARLITAEVQGESYDAKLAVGAVVLNRVKSDSFPNSINDVIYQVIDGYYQFTPVLNGWIDKTANEDCIQAAKEVLNGSDLTNGALFFFENSITNTWLLSRPVSITIDNMTFSY
jgi:LysM repeat protein